MYQSKDKGIIPNEAANHHEQVADHLIKEALLEAEQKGNKKIDLIAFSAGPGLGPSLHVGKRKAMELAKDLNVPLIGVNHAVAHLTSGLLLTKAKDPIYLYISGANTQIIAAEGKRFRIFGETLDVGLGNALDKFGRALGLGFPAGPKIEELAKKGKYIELPYTVKGMDAAFSGLVTKAVSLKEKYSNEDLCYSFQETSFAMITEIAERALAHTQKEELMLIGGVAANQRLCQMLQMMCDERKATFFAVPLKYAGDNAFMIAWQGLLEYQAGRREKEPDIRPYERAEDVEIIW